MQKYKKMITDVLLNIVATALPLVVLQLVILPVLAKDVDGEMYGIILTLISALTVVSGSLGNALNNIRLIKDTSYESEGVQGDFNVMLLGEIVIGAFCVVGYIYKFQFGLVENILIVILAVLWLVREYYIVVFRLNLNFKGIVLNNVVMVGGYILGYFLFRASHYWEMIYIFGMIFSLIYVISQSDIAKEPFAITPLFKGTLLELFFLVLAALINNLLNYADRMLIYPLIGSTAVSIYYASTLFGKMVSTAITPLNSVILSYLAKRKSINKNVWLQILGVSSVIACVGYIICRVIAYPALCIIYPQWADEAIIYVPITTAIAMVVMIISILSPFVMKFCKMKWQLIINAITLILYIAFSILLYNRYGMFGFCVGVLLSNIVKLLIMMVLGLTSARRSEGEIVQ